LIDAAERTRCAPLTPALGFEVIVSAESSAPCPQAVLENYFRAKDVNRPHMLEYVFAPEAELVVVNHDASAISFPARTLGREAIADVLVRNFGQIYENVYSFYLSSPPAAGEAFSCGWLVAMSEKQGKSARVGCGRYDWSFAKAAPHLATHLTITIHAMQVLPSHELAPVLAWVQALGYPWCSAEEATRTAPSIELLAPVLQHLASYGPGA
jgi:hypothetical protein